MTLTILNAAHTIKLILPELLDPETAAQVDQQLETLLTQEENGQLVEYQITKILRTHETTQTWMGRYLEGEAPADITRSISELAGNKTATPRKHTHFCPVCNLTYAEIFIGDSLKCDAHPNEILKPIQPEQTL
jgi:TPP-dependent indolepyruvate ferredoxin oxidoreductase alpha subunit